MSLPKPLLVRISLFLLITGMLTSLTLIPTAAVSQSLIFTPTADSYTHQGNPNTNYGTANTIRVDGSPQVTSYLRFTVSGLGGQVIGQATLLIHANSSSTQGLAANAVADNTWDERTINYTNAPPLGSTLATSPAVKSGSWISLDVTNYVTEEGIYTFGVTTPGSTAISLSSRESGANSPQLIVNGDGSSTPTNPPDTATPVPTSTSVSGNGSAIQHVFVVVMENHSYDQIWNSSASQYIKSLGNSYARATNYFALIHPSLPNYLQLFGGSNYGITTDCSPSSSCHINAVNLADTFEARGLAWKGYMESMPSPCGLTTSGKYAPRHNPMVYFDDIRNDTARCNAHVVAYTALANDLQSTSTTPNYALIIPNNCNNMHDCSVSTGDNWLANNLPAILNSPACLVDTCLLVLTFDEDDGSQSNQVLTLFAGSGAKTGGVVSSNSYTTYSLLRTVEYIFGLPALTSNDSNASPMTDLLR